MIKHYYFYGYQIFCPMFRFIWLNCVRSGAIASVCMQYTVYANINQIADIAKKASESSNQIKTKKKEHKKHKK